MGLTNGVRKAVAIFLTFILVSCGAGRGSGAVLPPQDLTRYALVFERKPDGQVTHAWVPLKELDLTRVQSHLSATRAHRDILRVSTSGLDAYCEGRREQCEADCLASSTPFTIGWRKYQDTKTQPWRIARGRWCTSNCLEAAIECKKGRGEWAEDHAAEFDAVEPAIDWIKNHRTELAVGAVVVIAGVAFAVVVAGSGGGALVLAPLLLMADAAPEMSSGVQLAGACK